MSFLARLLASAPPDAAVEIAPGHVSAAVLGSRGRDRVVHAYASEPLPPGAVIPSVAAANLVEPAIVGEALRRVLGRLGRAPARVGLVVPDTTARVSLVRFDQVPSRRDDLDQLIRWQIRKATPFPITDAVVSYAPAAHGAEGGTEFVVVAARRDIIREYEAACESAGMSAGLVDLATLNVANLFMAAATVPQGDWMLVHMRPEYTSLVILRGGDVMFFRSRPESEEITLADLVHQTAMYYEDRLAGRGFTRVLLGGSGADENARQSLEDRLGVAVETIDATRIAPLADRITADAATSAALAPLVGMLLRAEREAAA